MADSSKTMVASAQPETSATSELVKLDQDHPGFRDANYRRRRNEIALLALNYRVGDPVPTAPYTEAEHDVWRRTWEKLGPLQQTLAAESYLQSSAELALDKTKIPQLADVNVRLQAATGFAMLPVGGLAQPVRFFSQLADRIFLSTQYVRHHSRPLYTPEPDVIHELVGHAATLVNDDYCRLNVLFGEAMLRADTPARVSEVTRLYWYTLEFGLLDERGGPKAYGAGLLSSFGELGRCLEGPQLRPLRVADVVKTSFDPTDYQTTLFVADSLVTVEREVRAWLGSWS